MAPRTLERILDGAMDAVARHGLAKLEMSDVSASAGVSRGTVYRYFPNREALVAQLAQREGLRFHREMLEAIEGAPPGSERILVALQQATHHVREHRVLQRLLETEPAFLLGALRAQLPRIRAQFTHLLGPLLEQTQPVQSGVVTAQHLVDWTVRLMVSAFLLPESPNEDMAQDLTAVYRMLTVPLAGGTARPGRRAKVARRILPAPRRAARTQQGRGEGTENRR
jgi:AcrR family transcriptional regulator